MKPQRIVAATDFSEVSLKAVESAFELARIHNALVYLLFVREPPPSIGVAGLPLIPDDLDGDGEERLELLIPEGMWSRTQIVVLEGSPAHQIAAYSARVRADLIVVGTHGRSGLSRVLLGSTAEALVREAPCSVLVAKQQVKVAPSEEAKVLAGSTV